MTNKEPRREALEKVMCYRLRHLSEFDTPQGWLPEAACAVYDISDRPYTSKACLNWAIRTLAYVMNPYDVYMYDPLAMTSLDTPQYGYKWYTGQHVIVYQITSRYTAEMKDFITMEILKQVCRRLSAHAVHSGSRCLCRLSRHEHGLARLL